MGYDKSFDNLSSLGLELLSEVVRDGELRLQSQLDAANAADQRAMAWAGFLITIVVATVGGAITLVLSRQHWLLAITALFFAINVMAAAIQAMDSARPSGFCFPGNYPRNWLPENWNAPPSCENDWIQARKEQASDLDNRITENTDWAKVAGRRLGLSMDLLLFAVTFWAIIACLVIIVVDH